MHSIKHLFTIIEKEINNLEYSKNPKSLYEPISYIMTLGGKRMRSILLLLSNQIFSDNINTAIKPALGIEVFHNFTLIHDDIMDNAPLRRGKETIHEKWDQNTAILSGDTMLIQSYLLMLQSPDLYLKKVLSLFSETAIKVCEGQQYDMDFENDEEVSILDYINMIENKTAVLLASSLKIGAIIGGANEKDAQSLYEFGKNIGIAFQIKDDLLDAYGDPNKFGKKIGGDIDENKKTILFLQALSSSNYSDRKILLDLYNPTVHSKNKKSAVMSIFDKYDIYEQTNNQVLAFHKLALEHLESVKKKNKEPLYDFANQLLKREV